MSDKTTIEIDCDHGVVSINTDTAHVFSLDGTQLVRIGRADLIAQCLMPQLRVLMKTPETELKRLSLVAMGVVKE